MFKDAVLKVREFTRPIQIITREYKQAKVIPGLATLFFINETGCAITCKHVAEDIILADQINNNYFNYKNEKNLLKQKQGKNINKELRELAKKYNYGNGVTVNAKINFIDIPDTNLNEIEINLHPVYDLAAIQFKNYTKLNYNAENIVLLEDESEIEQGKSLCRLGFPFPEYTNYKYDKDLDDIFFTGDAANVPIFPIDGILTRHMVDEYGNIYGIELSTPGLRGQSGGPLFDREGKIFGIQSETAHLHLGFDMNNVPIDVGGNIKKITNQPFLHVGNCVHINVIKKFLDELNISYKTA